MPNLLFELGCEELPASFVRKAYEDLERLTGEGLTEARLSFESSQSLGTPRRLIIGINGIQDRQEDLQVEQRGPSLQAAFDGDGNPTKALEGFCRGQGVDPSQVERREEYVWVTKSVAGKSAMEVLQEVLPGAVQSLTFAKTMRWGGGKMRFARPIKWFLASLDGACVPFEVGGVQSGLKSRGHRFDAPAEFEAKTWDELIDGLRERNVEPDPVVREGRIREEAMMVSTGVPDLPEALVDENTFLTEWPTAHQGEFSEDYLNLPDPVLVTAMAKHERFFPVRTPSGEITNKFVSIRNSGDEATVKAGNEWVLNARFNDAQFFFEEDQRSNMDEFLAQTERMLFQDKLGTIRERADRLADLMAEFTKWCNFADCESDAKQAGLYAKADLSTGLVNELSSLQGVVGGDYARREGMPERVAGAIATQYNLKAALNLNHPLGVGLLICDQVDKLVGFLGLGLVPKGSSDPFGLRRAVTLLIEAAWGRDDLGDNYSHLLVKAHDRYANQEVSYALDKVVEIFEGRYESMMGNVRHDILDAALADRSPEIVLSPRAVKARCEALAKLAEDEKLVQTLTRPLNILSSARGKGILIPESFDSSSLKTSEGKALADAIQNTDDLKQLEKPIHDFFEATMVMDEDESVRAANLGLLAQVEQIILRTGDFSRIVQEG
ncbi:MAG: glycine--tRNA ligase subunit beta [Armatimonadetes bacterium]|nr:glycine--tRNA ligase subunit beta [Armatimonadota bacterium]